MPEKKSPFLKKLKTLSIAGFALATTLLGTGCTEKQQNRDLQKYLATQQSRRQTAAENLVQGKWQLSIPKSSSMWKTVGKTGFPRYTSPQQLKDHQEFLNDLLSTVSMGRGYAQQNLNNAYASIGTELQINSPASIVNKAVRDAQLATMVLQELDNYDLSSEASRNQAMAEIHSQIIPASERSKAYSQAKAYADRTQADRYADF